MGTTVYLHIGMPKTGSTSIQHTFFRNRATLLASGINYLPLGRNHAGSLMPLLSENPHKHSRNLRKGIDTPQKAQSRNKAISQRLARELSRNGSAKLVISGEAFSAASFDEVRRLKDLLDPYAERYRIIVYVRDPYEYANSAALQRIKGGAVIGNSAGDIPLPRYRQLQNYIEIFGRTHIDIRIFDSKRFVGGDLIADFLHALGESPDLTKGMEIIRTNRSLSHEAAMIMSEINAGVPVHINGYGNPLRATNIRFLMEAIEGVKYSCDPQCYLKRENKILTELQWLHKQIGERVFLRPVPAPASVPRWGEATVRSILDLVRSMALKLHQLEHDQPANRIHTTLPAELEWLREAADPRQAIPSPSRLKIAPHFDQATVRSLARLIHDMAFRLEKAEVPTRKTPVRENWQSRLFLFVRRRAAGMLSGSKST